MWLITFIQDIFFFPLIHLFENSRRHLSWSQQGLNRSPFHLRATEGNVERIREPCRVIEQQPGHPIQKHPRQ